MGLGYPISKLFPQPAKWVGLLITCIFEVRLGILRRNRRRRGVRVGFDFWFRDRVRLLKHAASLRQNCKLLA